MPAGYGAIDEEVTLRPAPTTKRTAAWRLVVVGGLIIAGAVIVVGPRSATVAAPSLSVAAAATRTAPEQAPSVGAAATRPASAVADATWAGYKTAFAKGYADAEEEAAKRSNFEERMADLAQRNAVNGAPVFGMTVHSDRALGERAYMRGFQARSDRSERIAAELFDKADAAALETAAVDQKKLHAARSLTTTTTTTTTTATSWTPYAVVDFTLVDDVVTPVKNQGQCGSCWAFSAVEQIESQMVLAGAPPVTLSTQQVTSCTDAAAHGGDFECCDGCGGGDPSAAYEMLLDSVGLSPDAFWPYVQGLLPEDECVSETCTAKCDKDLTDLETEYTYIGPYATLKSYAYAARPCEGACNDADLADLATVASATPVSICVNAETWDDYVGGVLTDVACGGHASDDIDHCVQLVGYNAQADEPYWIVRNSWSSDWGQEGYIYLQLNETANTCGIANEATVVTIDGDWTDSSENADHKRRRHT